MTLLTKPGLYHQPARPSRRFGRLTRGDVPVLLGYTQRGPAHEPVRIESVRQFVAVFGAPVAGSFLHDGVRGFFETGGRTAYVVRVTGAAATVAEAYLGAEDADQSDATKSNTWKATAHFPVAALVPETPDPAIRSMIDRLRRRYGRSIPDPGGWANALTIRVRRLSLTRGTAGTDKHDRRWMYPTSISGLAEGCLIGVATTPGTDDPADWTINMIDGIDPLTGRITLAKDLTGISLGEEHALHFRTFSFEFEFLQAGQRLDLVSDLHLDERHPRAIQALISRRSPFVRMHAPKAADPCNPKTWPAEGHYALAGGDDALENIGVEDWQKALASQADNEEIALVAAPDLVFRPSRPNTDLGVSSRKNTCDLPRALAEGRVRGTVANTETKEKIAGARVLVAGSGTIATTLEDGSFEITGVPEGVADIRVLADGYVLYDGFVEPSLPDNPKPAYEVELRRLTDIKGLDLSQIETLQKMMADSSVTGAWRVAVADPPAPELSPDALLQWQARLFGNPRIFLVAPWLEVAHEDQPVLTRQPPSAHICGAFARGELAQGIHRSPANLALRHVKRVSMSLDNDSLDAFHAAGLNAIRALPGQGIRLMGSRTQAIVAAWRQVSVRRLFDAIEKTLQARLSWSVFEPNNVATRQIMGFAVSQFLEGLRRRGMFAGTTPEQSYSVQCDGENNIAAAIQRGEMLIDIGIAPSRPYEYILFSLAAHADEIEVTEQP